MKTLGNILWFILGGFIDAIIWALIGCVWCITIFGIPLGLQCFKFAKLALWPFGKEIVYNGGGGKVILNILWVIFTGLEMAIVYGLIGCLFCITLIGIPFGKQYFKFAKLSMSPFGAEIK